MTNLFELKNNLKIRGPVYNFETTNNWEQYCNIDKKKSFTYLLLKIKIFSIKNR